MATGQTNIGAKVYLSDTPFNEDIDLSDAQGASYTQLPNVGNVDDTGVDQDAAEYPTWDRALTVKGKGAATGMTTSIEVLDVPSPGMTAFLAAAAIDNPDNYILKIEWSDGSVEYNRGLVLSPSLPKGANDEFRRVVFPFAINQEPLFDDAGATNT